MKTLCDLIIQLLEKRDSNRRLVLDNAVLPLLEQFCVLHRNYLSSFHSYQNEIESLGVSRDLCNRVSQDLNNIVSSRMDIVGQLNSLKIVSDTIISEKNEYIVKLIDSILVYLNIHSTDFEKMCRMRYICYANPMLGKIYLELTRSDKDKVVLINFIDSIIRNFMQNYNKVIYRFSDTKIFLLTGK